MWVVEKVWRAGEEKKVLALPSAGEKHSSNLSFCRVLLKNTRQTYHFAECWGKTLGKVAHLLTAGTPSDGRRTCRSRDSILPSVNLLLCRIVGKSGFLPSVICMPSVFFTTLGKLALCRVPDGLHSAKQKTPGIFTVSGSVPR